MSDAWFDGLPESWVKATLGELTAPGIKQAPPEGGDQFLYVDISSVDNRAKRIAEPRLLPASRAPSRAKQHLHASDVLVSMTRPNLNAVAMLPREMEGAIGSTGFHVLRAVGIHPGWLLYLVQTDVFVQSMSLLVQGALYPAIRPKDISRFVVPLAPLAEQDRIIVEIEKQLTRLEAAEGALKRLVTNLKRYRAAVLKAACEGRLVPTEAELARAERRDCESADQLIADLLKERRAKWEADQFAAMQATGRSQRDRNWRARYKPPARPDTSDLPRAPDGWAWASVEELTAANGGMTTGPFGTLIGKSDQRATGVPVVGIPNITNKGFVEGNWHCVAPEKARQLRKYALLPGDLVVSRSGTVGQICLFPDLRGPAVMSTNLMRLRTVTVGQVNLGQWLVMNFKGSPTIQRQLEQLCKGSTRPFLNLEILSRLLIRLAPVGECERISQEVERRLSVIDELEATLEANLKRAARLRQGILKRAFEGRLVPQDPNDEPASVLLEGIRRERAAKAADGQRPGRQRGAQNIMKSRGSRKRR
jgi:type I restriction enzyme S subunit